MAGPNIPSSARLSIDIGGDTEATILPAERGSLIGPMETESGRHSRNAFRQPRSFVTGQTGEQGGNDPDNCDEDG
jgi:hypothetical protein